MAGGHGGSSGRYDRLHEAAFRYAFMLDAVGLAGGAMPRGIRDHVAGAGRRGPGAVAVALSLTHASAARAGPRFARTATTVHASGAGGSSIGSSVSLKVPQ